MHSHAQGIVGDFAFVADRRRLSLGDSRWAGGDDPLRRDHPHGELHEVGDRIVAGREPLRIFDMRLKRIGATDWPAAGAVPPR